MKPKLCADLFEICKVHYLRGLEYGIEEEVQFLIDSALRFEEKQEIRDSEQREENDRGANGLLDVGSLGLVGIHLMLDLGHHNPNNVD